MGLNVTQRADELLRAHGIALDAVVIKAAAALDGLGTGMDWDCAPDARLAPLDVVHCARFATGETSVEFHIAALPTPRLDPANAPVDSEQLYVQGDGQGYIILLTPDDDQDDGIARLARRED